MILILNFLILTLCLLAVIVLAILVPGNAFWSFFIPAGIGLVSVFAVLRGIILPSRTVKRGMELIRAQDFNNRLVKVGESNSDSIVELFNSIIDKLREERIYNREQEGLLRLLIDASPMGIVMLDFNDRISLVNSAFRKICGIQDSEHLSGEKIDALKFSPVPEILKVPLGENAVIRIDSSRLYRCYHLNFIQQGFKRHFYLIESLTEEIRKAERAAYEGVIRTISHEVNNTMGGVRTVFDLMTGELEGSDIGEVIESCSSRCEKMVGFINAYAEVVKLPEPTMVKLDLVKEMEDLKPFLEMMTPAGIRFVYELPSFEVNIRGDVTLLQQAFVNIVKNAIESISGDGEIKIKIELESSVVKLEISNNGKPIESNEKQKIFTPFYTSKPGGKGIGLTLVKEVLDRHNADYSLKTDGDGITRFLMLFGKG